MKKNYLFVAVLAMLCFIGCKKDSVSIETPQTFEQKDPLESLADSLSYIIDGKQIIHKRMEGHSSSIINDLANVKLDSVIKNQQYRSGDKDSVMFGRGFSFSDGNGNHMQLMFLKKYNKNQGQPKSNQTIFFIPANKLDLFTVGERKFALDFTRNNSLNGIAVELSGGYQSYGYSSLVHHKLLSKDLQSQSKFEILKLQQLKSGKYLIEAKFNMAVYWGDGTHIKNIENGYLRLKINPDQYFL